MNVLSFEDISISFGDKLVLNQISGVLEQGDKVGVVGVNGTGKSTLLKILAGLIKADSGQIRVGKEQSFTYLPQLPEVQENVDIMTYVFQWHQELLQDLQLYKEHLQKPQDEAWQRQLQDLVERLENSGAWQWESKAKNLLTRLGIKDYERCMGQLSGGERKRVALACALMEGDQVLILDEPTNHLDNEGTGWLEKILLESKNTLLMVTHDRYFLDRVATKIWELDQGKLYVYTGNYSEYLEGKARRLELEQNMEEKRQSLLRNELAWIRRGARARSTKQKARIQRFNDLQSQGTPADQQPIEIKAASKRLGKKILILEGVSKSIQDKCVIKPFSYTCTAGQRIGIIGANGAGKTTLLKLIADEIKPDAGLIDRGSTVNIGFFSQHAQELKGEIRVIDHVQEAANVIHLSDGQEITALKLCEMFLFKGAAAYTRVDKLSGGEKRRLQLLKILMQAPNVLLLDEPTNDLDTWTLTILEDYLQGFSGVVLAVSHDRYFLDKIATDIFSLEDGQIDVHKGNYSDYLEYKEQREALQAEAAKSAAKENKPGKGTQPRKKTKLSYKEQIEYDNIEAEIYDLEQELAQINSAIEEAFDDYVLLQELTHKQQEKVQAIEEKMNRWAELEEMAAQLQSES